jgi:predicted MFS family arabinose efflux permease
MIKARIYSLLVPWFMESGLVMLQTAVPLLAVRLGASWIMLGTIGWVAQAVRTPVCFTSGHLSERLGRTRIIVPAAIACAAMMASLGRAHTILGVMVFYAIAMTAIGAFYPPLQATIGDVSERGQLRKNLGAFNIGWCIGGAIAAWIAGQLVVFGLDKVFYTAACCCVVAGALVVSWRAKRVAHANSLPLYEESAAVPDEDFRHLLLISRMGHFASFFGFSVIRILFPKLGITAFGWSEATVAKVVAIFLWGLGAGIVIANVSAWWRGKLWPQVAAQCTMLASAAGVALVCSPALSFARTPAVIAALFFAFGMAVSIAYTGALYYGLSSRKGKGTNTGIHEALVAGAAVSGCLLGGIAAQKIALVAPFVLLAGLLAASLIATVAIWARKSARAL